MAPGEFRFPIGRLSPPESVTTVNLADYGMKSEFATAVHVVRLSDGEIWLFSATDPTGGCQVTWDARVRIFRNPCHGSTYSVRGEVLAGPAQQGLGLFAHKPKVVDRTLTADLPQPPVPVGMR